MLTLLIFLFCLSVAISMLYVSARSDFKSFTIPNEYPLVIVGTFVVAFLATSFLKSDVTVFSSFTSHIIAFAVVLVVTVMMYSFKLLGAGDSKLMAAVGLWLGLSGLVPFLFYMSVGGGALGLATLYLRKNQRFPEPPAGSWIDSAQKRRESFTIWHCNFIWRLHGISHKWIFESISLD